MVQITFVADDGQRTTIDAPNGESVMKAALNAGIDGIVGECGGNCACATCRVYLSDEWLAKLAPPETSEKEMVDYVGDDAPNVRLSCQIPVSDKIDGIELQMPESQY